MKTPALAAGAIARAPPGPATTYCVNDHVRFDRDPLWHTLPLRQAATSELAGSGFRRNMPYHTDRPLRAAVLRLD